jgi:predicted DCC family thiol-disulfide oxidoreductase YuxK
MISLTSEFTDTKSHHARAWLFYDSECRFCVRFARWIAPNLRAQGMELAPLQDPRVSDLLGLSRHELLRALRFVLADGRQFAGADAILALAREIWWAAPLAWLARIPGVTTLLHSAYAWLAARRGCAHAQCATVHS